MYLLFGDVVLRLTLVKWSCPQQLVWIWMTPLRPCTRLLVKSKQQRRFVPPHHKTKAIALRQKDQHAWAAARRAGTTERRSRLNNLIRQMSTETRPAPEHVTSRSDSQWRDLPSNIVCACVYDYNLACLDASIQVWKCNLKGDFSAMIYLFIAYKKKERKKV